jgi:hypothetical protein
MFPNPLRAGDSLIDRHQDLDSQSVGDGLDFPRDVTHQHRYFRVAYHLRHGCVRRAPMGLMILTSVQKGVAINEWPPEAKPAPNGAHGETRFVVEDSACGSTVLTGMTSKQGTSYLQIMGFPVAARTQRDQVVFVIISQPTPGINVMNFQPNCGTTTLAAPSVAL